MLHDGSTGLYVENFISIASNVFIFMENNIDVIGNIVASINSVLIADFYQLIQLGFRRAAGNHLIRFCYAFFQRL